MRLGEHVHHVELFLRSGGLGGGAGDSGLDRRRQKKAAFIVSSLVLTERDRLVEIRLRRGHQRWGEASHAHEAHDRRGRELRRVDVIKSSALAHAGVDQIF